MVLLMYDTAVERKLSRPVPPHCIHHVELRTLEQDLIA